jgi:hypothetical protein
MCPNSPATVNGGTNSHIPARTKTVNLRPARLQLWPMSLVLRRRQAREEGTKTDKLSSSPTTVEWDLRRWPGRYCPSCRSRRALLAATMMPWMPRRGRPAPARCALPRARCPGSPAQASLQAFWRWQAPYAAAMPRGCARRSIHACGRRAPMLYGHRARQQRCSGRRGGLM